MLPAQQKWSPAKRSDNCQARSTVSLSEMTSTHTSLVVAGPRSRELLQSLSPRCDWSKSNFPWMSVKEMNLGHARVTAMSVSFSGELSYELHIPNEQLYIIWSLLVDAGAVHNLSRFGLYATESMRMEKGYRHWKADLIYERNPMESVLERFVDLNKDDFIGKAALLQEIDNGPRRLFVTLIVDCDSASAHAGDPIYSGNEIIGTITSGGFGHRVGKNIAFAFVKPEFALKDTELAIGILGERYKATICDHCLYDKENKLVRDS